MVLLLVGCKGETSQECMHTCLYNKHQCEMGWTDYKSCPDIPLEDARSDCWVDCKPDTGNT